MKKLKLVLTADCARPSLSGESERPGARRNRSSEVRGQSRVSHKGREGHQESEEKLTFQGTSAPTSSEVRCRLDFRSPSVAEHIRKIFIFARCTGGQ